MSYKSKQDLPTAILHTKPPGPVALALRVEVMNPCKATAHCDVRSLGDGSSGRKVLRMDRDPSDHTKRPEVSGSQ